MIEVLSVGNILLLVSTVVILIGVVVLHDK